MNLLVSILAEIVQLLVMVAGAVCLDGLRGWLTARLAGRGAPAVMEPWHALRRILRKRPVRGEAVIVAAAVMPVVALAAHVAAALLVPGFTVELVLAPAGGGFVVVGLLMVGRMALEAGARAPTAGIWSDAALLAAAMQLKDGGAGLRQRVRQRLDRQEHRQPRQPPAAPRRRQRPPSRVPPAPSPPLSTSPGR